jgi:NAD(P)-dependent dehydrogenase (short-subunit alcohol dehydrogenase family)
VVTGANSGVGFEAARSLARLGAQVVMVCRSRERGEVAREKIRRSTPSARLRLEITDLGRLSEVRELGSTLLSDLPAIHALVNNAGVYRGRLERTEDGYERTFAVNHLSHFLLTQLLLPRLLAEGGRVINVSSDGHRRSELSPESLEEVARGRRAYNGVVAYCDSKLANVLFANELARRYQASELAACSMHPGVLATRIWNQDLTLFSGFMSLFKPFMGRPTVGGAAVTFLAREQAEGIHGRYFHKQKEVAAAPLAHDARLARSLWELSLELTGSETP